MEFVNPPFPEHYNGESYDVAGLIVTDRSARRSMLYIMITRSSMDQMHQRWSLPDDARESDQGICAWAANTLFPKLMQQRQDEAKLALASSTWLILRGSRDSAQVRSDAVMGAGMNKVLEGFYSTINKVEVKASRALRRIAVGSDGHAKALVNWPAVIRRLLTPGPIQGGYTLAVAEHSALRTVDVLLFKDSDDTIVGIASFCDISKQCKGTWLGRKNYQQTAKQLADWPTPIERDLMEVLHRLLLQASWGSLTMRNF